MPKILEFHIQRAVVIWLRPVRDKRTKEIIRPSPLIPGVVWWHTPNGGSRDGREAKAFQEMGVLAGIPDLWFLWGGLYGLELKKTRGRLSDVQIELHPQLEHAGAKIATHNNLADAKAQIVAWNLCR